MSEMIKIPIVGMSPLVPNKPCKVNKEQSIDEAEAYCYRVGDAYGMPARAFKVAMVSACECLRNPTAAEVKSFIWVEGIGDEGLVPFDYESKELHKYVIQDFRGNAVIRYQNHFLRWTAILRIWYATISREAVVALVDAAGKYGIGAWRPSLARGMAGAFGMWSIKSRK